MTYYVTSLITVFATVYGWNKYIW